MTSDRGTSDRAGGTDLDLRLRTVAATHLDVDPARLLPAARLGEDLCVDSLDAVELTMVLEDEFDIALPEDVTGCIRTYGDIVTLVRDRVEARSAGPGSDGARPDGDRPDGARPDRARSDGARSDGARRERCGE